MKATYISIAARSLGNGRPISGDVTFEDGNTYGWSQHDEEMRFHGSRTMPHGGVERFSFRSDRRASALIRALDGAEPDAVVEDYITRYLREYHEETPAP